MASAGGAVMTGVKIGTAVLGCSFCLGGGFGAVIGSKLNGRRCSVGGGRGDRGEMSGSLGSAAWRVGEGVISGVSVSTILVGGGGAGLCALRRLKPVLLFPRTCLGEIGPPFARGFEGSPKPGNTFRGGAGAGAENLSSSGVGGIWFTVGFSCCLTSRTLSSTSFSDTFASSTPASTLFFRGADVGGKGPPFPPRGPAPNCAKPTNFFAAGAGSAFLFTTGAASTVAGLSATSGLLSSCERSESFLASSDCDFDCFRVGVGFWMFDRLADFSGGGGGGDGTSFGPVVEDMGKVWDRADRAGVGGTMAVEPLLVTRLKDGGFPSRDKLRKGILRLARALEGSLLMVFGESGASSITRNWNFTLILCSAR